MPIEPPRLDDLRYDRTVEELKRRIPVYAPEWTDHNDSDPGIALIQIFGHLAEQIGYRLNRVPEKNHVELLKLLGVRLQPAHAATSRVALLLEDPRRATGRTLQAGARVRSQRGTPPTVYETDVDVDLVPAQMVSLITTKNPHLHDLLRDPGAAPDSSDLFSVVWDGGPSGLNNLKKLPTDPVLVRGESRPDHNYLWIGLAFNRARDAGFLDVRVTLTVQFDDDERPDLTYSARCERPVAGPESPPAGVDWLRYYDVSGASGQPVPSLRSLPGRVDDRTDGFRRSGTIRFTVPASLGAVPGDGWRPLREAPTVSPLDQCWDAVTAATRAPRSPSGTVVAPGARPTDVGPLIPHPLATNLRGADGWLRVDLSSRGAGTLRIRMVTFNAAPITQAVTVRNELLARSDGRPGQEYDLSQRNVLRGSLVVAVQEDSDPAQPLVTWTETPSLDTASPDDRVFALDPEAGRVLFGDGVRGRIPPLVPNTGHIVALRYQHGGGESGNAPVGVITNLETTTPGVGGVVNYVAAKGGRDAETLDEAKLRARKDLSTRTRAVTSEDFAWIAKQTPDVRVARAHVVPLRRPLLPEAAGARPGASGGRALPPSGGLDDRRVPGAVTVIVVPAVDGPEPTPEPSFLRAVARHLDSHRLITTEVFVAPPQYFRIYNVNVRVRGKPGYTRALLQDNVADRLKDYLHVLRGGEDGAGFPFGGQVHVADLMAQVYRTDGVERVEHFSADFTRTRRNARPQMGALVLCPATGAQFDKIELLTEECASFDKDSLTLSTVA